jgi:hypothetical protein
MLTNCRGGGSERLARCGCTPKAVANRRCPSTDPLPCGVRSALAPADYDCSIPKTDLNCGSKRFGGKG